MMKRMKKQVLVMTTAVLLTACGAGRAMCEENAEEPAVDLYTSDLIVVESEGEGQESNTEQYSLKLTSDTEAVFTAVYDYSNGMKSTCEYRGTYSIDQDKDQISFLYGTESGSTEYLLSVSGQQITSVDISYNNSLKLKEYAGTYTSEDGKYGTLDLCLDEGGNATVTCSCGNVFIGSIYDYSGNWNFVGYDENAGESVDWIITLEGDQFRYKSFQSFLYGEYAGTYTTQGDLGTLTFDVSTEGVLTINVPLDGREIAMTGDIYVDSDLKTVNGLYARSEDGYSISLTLKELEEEEGSILNYSGSYSVPLGAG